VDAEALRTLLARHQQLAGGQPIYAVDISTWPRCDAEASPERGFYYHPSRHSAGQPIVAGWAFQWIAPVDARRLHRVTTPTRSPSPRSTRCWSGCPPVRRRCLSLTPAPPGLRRPAAPAAPPAGPPAPVLHADDATLPVVTQPYAMTPDERLERLNRELVQCRRCPRLVEWRERVAREKRAAFRDQEYWGRPVPGFGDPVARLLILGLAPAAHGGNRTGRIFTGDRSGDWLFGSLHRTGFANQPTSVARGDGLALRDCYITAPVKCAPPDNKPLPEERDTCAPWLTLELGLLDLRVVVALGAFAWDQALRHLGPVRPKPRFGHAAEAPLPAGRTLLGSYHVSQQNTQTGRLTEAMLDGVFARAWELLDDSA
jgi:uracil-DNA glycosylase family 4